MINHIKTAFRQEPYLTTPLSLVTSPLYFIRRGLYTSILRFAPRIEGDLLDFGCGSKPYQSLFNHAATYIGVDIEQSGHDHTTSRVDVFYNGKDLPFEDNHFDATIAFEVFEHIFNIDEVIVEIKRVLKPGGKMLLSIPFAWDEHEVPYDFARYTSYGIQSILERNGFEVLEIEKTTTYVRTIGQMLTAYLAQHAAPKNWYLSKAFQLLFIFPLNLLILILDGILPTSYDYFCNSVVLARKRTAL